MPFAGGMGDVSKQLAALLKKLPKKEAEPASAPVAYAPPMMPVAPPPNSERPSRISNAGSVEDRMTLSAYARPAMDYYGRMGMYLDPMNLPIGLVGKVPTGYFGGMGSPFSNNPMYGYGLDPRVPVGGGGGR
jgi:hypothetical protein